MWAEDVLLLRISQRTLQAQEFGDVGSALVEFTLHITGRSAAQSPASFERPSRGNLKLPLDKQKGVRGTHYASAEHQALLTQAWLEF